MPEATEDGITVLAGLRGCIAGLVVVGVLVGCSDRTGGPSGGTEEDVAASVGLETVDEVLLDTVAPYDADSFFSTDPRAGGLGSHAGDLLDACIESEDVTPAPWPSFGEDGPITTDYLQSRYPDIDQLVAVGFGEFVIVDEPDQELDWSSDMAEGQEDAIEHCEQEDPAVRDVRTAQDQLGYLATQWDAVLEDVDESDELVDLREAFSACVLDEGVEERYSLDEVAFVSVLHGLATTDPELLDEVNEQRRDMGQIYGRCSRDLWERKVELRLEQRDDFFAEHGEQIVAVDELLATIFEGVDLSVEDDEREVVGDVSGADTAW